MSKTIKQREEELKKPAFCELLPVRDFLDNVMVRDDGSFVAGFRLGGSQTYFADDASRNDLKRTLETLFLTIPEDSLRVQFRYEVDESVGDLLDRYERSRTTQNERMVQMDQERIAVWEKQAKRGEYLTRMSHVYFIWNPITDEKKMKAAGGPVAPKQDAEEADLEGATEKSGADKVLDGYNKVMDFLFGSASVDKSIQRSRKEHEDRLNRFETLILGARSALVKAGLGPQRMTHEELFLEVKRSLSPVSPNVAPFRTPSTVVPETGKLSAFAISERYQSAREQLSVVAIDGQDGPYISIGGILWACVTVKTPPDATSPNTIRELLTLGLPIVVNTHLTVQDQDQVLRSLKARYKKYAGALKDRKGGARVDKDAEVAAREILALQEKIISSASKALKLTMTIMVRTSEPAYTHVQHEAALRTIAERVQKVMYVVGRMNNAVGLTETLSLRDLMIDSLPGMAGELPRDLPLLTEHAADLVPVEMPWAGTTDDFSMLVRTPYRQLIPVSHFSPTLENANMILAATSGTGKGMFVGKMLLTYARQDAKVSILERGDTYAAAVDYLGGKMLTMSLDSDHSINPFDLDPGQQEPENDHLAFLKTLIRFMVGDSASSDTDLLDAAILAAVKKAYQVAQSRENTIPTLSDVRDELRFFKDKEHNQRLEDEARQAATKLRPWVDDGMYAKLFDRQTSVDMTAPWLYFNIEKLKSEPKLETAMSLLIAYTTTKRAQGTGQTRSITVLDECWSLLQNEFLGDVIEQLFRTARKRRACIWAVSQSIGDFTGTIDKPAKFGEAILTTTAVKMIGRQKGNVEVLDHFVHLNATTVNYIKNLGMTEKGVMSEFVGIIGEAAETTWNMQVVTTPREYWVMTTYPREKDFRAYWLAKYSHLPLEERYGLLAEKYPQGIAALPKLPEEMSGEVYTFKEPVVAMPEEELLVA